MKISNDVANVLANSCVEENRLFLPPEQLDRKLYVSVNKVLEAIGGKWNRREKAHLFDECPEETIFFWRGGGANANPRILDPSRLLIHSSLCSLPGSMTRTGSPPSN
jgi:hypothetical protein